MDPYSQFLQDVEKASPKIAIVTGSGLRGIKEILTPLATLPFAAVPELPLTTVPSHHGELILGSCKGHPVLISSGRLHLYEGLSSAQITGIIRLFVKCKIPRLLLTNAAGGIHPDLSPGSFMMFKNHLELLSPTDWKKIDSLKSSSTSIYENGFSEQILQIAEEIAIPLLPGTYACMTGPCYETPSEIRALRSWGADAVGMSTTREATHGYENGLHVAAISLITNVAAGLSNTPLSHKEVLETGHQASEQLINLIEQLISV